MTSIKTTPIKHYNKKFNNIYTIIIRLDNELRKLNVIFILLLMILVVEY